MTMLKLGFYGLIILLAIPNGSSIKCWDCRSDFDPKCADTFDNSTFPISNCRQIMAVSNADDYDSIVCSKIKRKVNDKWNIVRGCANERKLPQEVQKTTCFKEIGADNILTEICTCRDKDGCNSSSKFQALSTLLLVIPTLLFKLISGA